MNAWTKRLRSPELLWCAGLVLVVALLFLFGAPGGGAFSYPDAPRHALNGAFVLDLVADAPLDDPAQYAYDYYSKYPALTILFYPPLFYVVLAPFYALFGVSQETALFVEFLFYATLVVGMYFLARRWLDAPASFGAALALAAAPEVGLWGRQVMLEIPAFALLIWSTVFFVRHLQERKVADLYVSAALLVLAMYMRLSVVFMILPYLVVLLRERGIGLLRDRHAYIIAGLALAGLAPLAVLTLKFGGFNLRQSASGVSGDDPSVLDPWTWLWYAQALPEQVGLPVFAAALAFVVICVWRAVSGDPIKGRGYFFLAAWVAAGYLFFSAIAHKESRFDIFLLAPVALAAAFACREVFPKKPNAAATAAIIIGVSTLALTALTRPVLFVDGYADVVRFVSGIAPKNSTIVFSGYRDGAFIFNMRALSNRPDLSVVRADKLLLKLAVYREAGVEQKQYSDAEIGSLINSVGAHYVVAQPDFWTDLDEMARLQTVLKGAQFKEIRRFKMHANYNAQEKELVVYRNLGDVAKGPVTITNEVPFIDRVITGKPNPK